MSRWFKKIVNIKFLRDMLEVVGALYLGIEIWVFFFPLNTSQLKANNSLYLLLFISIVYALLKNRPKNNFEYIVKNRDTSVMIKIGDALKNKGAIVIPINDEFDIDLNGNVLKTNSLQSNFIKKYFNSKSDILQEEINNKLNNDNYKKRLSNGKYSMGTVLEISQKGKTFYFVVNSSKNASSHVFSTKKNLEQTLPELWNFLANEARKEDVLTIPLIGTGMGRLDLTREEVFQEIVKSFIASCSDKSLCDKLIISIHPKDVQRLKIDVDQVDDYLRSQCLYANFEKKTSSRTGQAIE